MKMKILIIFLSSPYCSSVEYLCTECPTKLTTRTGLLYHLKRHAGEVNFKCDYCDRGFIHRKQFKEHLSKHTKVVHIYLNNFNLLKTDLFIDSIVRV